MMLLMKLYFELLPFLLDWVGLFTLLYESFLTLLTEE